MAVIELVTIAFAFCTVAEYVIFKSKPREKLLRRAETLIVLGSGGHSTEMIMIVAKLPSRYYPRIYLYGEDDSLSAQRVKKTEEHNSTVEGLDYNLIQFPRPRKVGQSYFTSVFSTLKSFLCVFLILRQKLPDLVNGA